MNKANFTIPKQRSEKIKLLKDLQTGKRTIAEVFNLGYNISMWKVDETDEDYLISFDGTERVSKKDYEKSMLTDKAIYVTLDLNSTNY